MTALLCNPEGRNKVRARTAYHVKFNLTALPVGYGPGIEAAHSLVGHVSQVGVVRCFVPSNAFQRATAHRDASYPARLNWAREGGPGLPCILGYRYRHLLLLRQAVVRDQTVREGNRRGC